MVSGTKLFSGDALIRIMSSAPILSCSMVSFSEPRAPLGNTLTPSLPPLAVRELLAHELDGLDGRIIGGVDVGRAEIACVGGNGRHRQCSGCDDTG